MNKPNFSFRNFLNRKVGLVSKNLFKTKPTEPFSALYITLPMVQTIP